MLACWRVTQPGRPADKEAFDLLVLNERIKGSSNVCFFEGARKREK